MPKAEKFRLPDDILEAIASRVAAGDGNKTEVVIAALRRGFGLLAESSKSNLQARVEELEAQLQELSQIVKQHSTVLNNFGKHDLIMPAPGVEQESTLKNLVNFDKIFRNLSDSIEGSSSFPPLICRKNPAGAGYEASIVFILNEAVHVTIYKSSWDGKKEISSSLLGPFCLHITAHIADKTLHLFKQYDTITRTWDYLLNPNDDHSPYLGQVARSIELIITAISSYLGSLDLVE